MKKALQMYTVRDYIGNLGDLKSSLRKIKAIGYEAIQMGTPAYMTDVEYKMLLDEYGLETCSSNGGYNLLGNPEKTAAAIKTANILNTKYIGIGTIPAELRSSADGYKKFAFDMNSIGKELNKEGCVLYYHAHAIEHCSFGGGLSGLDILIKETDPAFVYFNLDTHWLAAGGCNPVDWIYKVSGRSDLIHFKDYGISFKSEHYEAVPRLFKEVGEGNLNWPDIIKACFDTKILFAIVEQDVCERDVFESINISYNNMCKFGI